ncbi:MAG: DUF86 domain-containing protein [Bacteroidetes bacterium]|nr:DUF86 domain-containing protein [Bacteroidota bacterium]
MSLSQVDFLRLILDECIYLIKESQQCTFEEFLANDRLTRAVCRSLEIIGEASSKIHPDFKAKYPLIPWRDMSDIRNKIIHHYFGVDYDIIWDTIKTNIPQLKGSIEIVIELEKS